MFVVIKFLPENVDNFSKMQYFVLRLPRGGSCLRSRLMRGKILIPHLIRRCAPLFCWIRLVHVCRLPRGGSCLRSRLMRGRFSFLTSSRAACHFSAGFGWSMFVGFPSPLLGVSLRSRGSCLRSRLMRGKILIPHLIPRCVPPSPCPLRGLRRFAPRGEGLIFLLDWRLFS
jgi:hypothetical protein